MKLRDTVLVSVVLLLVVAALGCSLGPTGSGPGRVRRAQPTRTPKPTFTATPAMMPTPAQVSTPTPTPPPLPTDTPVPTDTPAPPPPLEAVVDAGPVNLRQGPGTNYPRIGQANGGDRLPVLGRNQAGDWYQIRLADGNVGWIAGSLVTLSDPAAAIAVAPDIPPPPTPKPVPPTNTPVPPPPAEPTPAWQFIPSGGYAGAPNLGLTRVYGEIKDTAGNPVNGYRLKLNCYGNVFISYPSGPSPDVCERVANTGWAPGFYDFTVATQARTMDCYISVIDRSGCEGEGTPLSEEHLLHFEAPNETILIWNWTKNW